MLVNPDRFQSGRDITFHNVYSSQCGSGDDKVPNLPRLPKQPKALRKLVLTTLRIATITHKRQKQTVHALVMKVALQMAQHGRWD